MVVIVVVVIGGVSDHVVAGLHRRGIGGREYGQLVVLLFSAIHQSLRLGHVAWFNVVGAIRGRYRTPAPHVRHIVADQAVAMPLDLRKARQRLIIFGYVVLTGEMEFTSSTVAVGIHSLRNVGGRLVWVHLELVVVH